MNDQKLLKVIDQALCDVLEQMDRDPEEYNHGRNKFKNNLLKSIKAELPEPIQVEIIKLDPIVRNNKYKVIWNGMNHSSYREALDFCNRKGFTIKKEG